MTSPRIAVSAASITRRRNPADPGGPTEPSATPARRPADRSPRLQKGHSP